MSLGVGSRLPAYATAMGRVLLAGLDDEQVAAHLASTPLEPLTHRTTTDPARLHAIVAAVREQGFALVDEELELGLRSLSVPLRTMDGRTLAALNLCAATARVSVEEMHTRLPPRDATHGLRDLQRLDRPPGDLRRSAREHLVGEAHDHRAVADGARDALGGAGADVARGEDARADGLEHVRLAVGQRPVEVAVAASPRRAPQSR